MWCWDEERLRMLGMSSKDFPAKASRRTAMMKTMAKREVWKKMWPKSSGNNLFCPVTKGAPVDVNLGKHCLLSTDNESC